MTLPKKFDRLDAPAEILKLVDQLMPLLLAGEHPTLEILRRQVFSVEHALRRAPAGQ